MSVEEQIKSLLEVITFIITKMSPEEAMHLRTTIFSDYFRKHLNLLEELKKENNVKEKLRIKLQKNIIVNQNLEKVNLHNESRNDKAEKDKTEIENLSVPNLMEVENNPKRLKTQKLHIPTPKLVIKAQTLESLSENKRERNMDALNEMIFDAKQPTLKDQTINYDQNQIAYLNHQSQISFKLNKPPEKSSGLELQTDNVMAIKDTSPVIEQRKKVQGDKMHCTLCRKYYYISQKHYCFTVSNGKEILCNLCEYRFDSIKTFKIHFSLKHFQEYKDNVEKNYAGWPLMPCPSCDKVFANAEFLLQHIQDIHDREDTVLDYSGIIEGTYELTDASAYCEENKPNSPVIDFKCRECGMRFSKNETLKAHEDLHGKK